MICDLRTTISKNEFEDSWFKWREIKKRNRRGLFRGGGFRAAKTSAAQSGATKRDTGSLHFVPPADARAEFSRRGNYHLTQFRNPIYNLAALEFNGRRHIA
jgi:hypothetical protein